MQRKGVDLSTHNGDVDFAALQAAGVEFAILRCGYGGDYPHQDDVRFAENVAKAQAAGMPWGAYLYSYAKTVDMAQSEARHALRLLEGAKPLYGVWYDVEDPQLAGVDVAATSEAFCLAMEEAGLYAGIYASLSWLEGPLADPRLNRFDKWVAQWNATCTYGGDYGLWQFTDRWDIGGSRFDGNWAYRDYPALVRSLGQGQTDAPEGYEAWKTHLDRYLRELAAQPASSWAQEAVSFAQQQGLMSGDAAGGFRPHSPLSRQEAAALVRNLLSQGENP